MAIDGKVYSGKEVEVGFAEETTFGTPVAASGSFTQICEFDSVSINYGLTQIAEPRYCGDRTVRTNNLYTTQAGGLREITLSGVIPNLTDFAPILYGVFQNVTESATAPYKKTYNHWSAQPDFASNGGEFFTVGVKSPISGQSELFTSCIIKNIKMSSDMVSDDGRMKVDITFISAFDVTLTTFTGTWTSVTRSYFDYHNADTKTLNGADLVLYSWELNIENNAVRVGQDSSGKGQTYAIGIPKFEWTGSITTKYDDNTSSVLTDFLAGTTRTFELIIGTSGTNALEIYLEDIYYTGHEKQLDAAEGQQINIPFEVVYDGSTYSYISLEDGVDRSW